MVADEGRQEKKPRCQVRFLRGGKGKGQDAKLKIGEDQAFEDLSAK
jgi:hypothetical protein